MLLLPLTSTLFPYTTLFRSIMCPACITNVALLFASATSTGGITAFMVNKLRRKSANKTSGQERTFMSTVENRKIVSRDEWRSEEHTSELQSRENLVCRLLLE